VVRPAAKPDWLATRGGQACSRPEVLPQVQRAPAADGPLVVRGAQRDEAEQLGCALDNGSLVGAAELAWQPALDDPALLGG
jgi:hypothetical protein